MTISPGHDRDRAAAQRAGRGQDEKPEDKAKLDKEFKESQKKLEEKLSQEKASEKWVYLVSTWTGRSAAQRAFQLMAEKKEEPKKDEKVSTGEPPKSDEPKEPSAIVPPAKPRRERVINGSSRGDEALISSRKTRSQEIEPPLTRC